MSASVFTKNTSAHLLIEGECSITFIYQYKYLYLCNYLLWIEGKANSFYKLVCDGCFAIPGRDEVNHLKFVIFYYKQIILYLSKNKSGSN